MQLSNYLKVPITYFFEDFKNFNDIKNLQDDSDDLNYSFLSKTFSSLSKTKKKKIFQILKNTVSFRKNWLVAPRAGLEPATN